VTLDTTTHAEHQGRRLHVFRDRASGLRAILVIDAVRGGFAAGGTRTRTYASAAAAVQDAAALGRAMTLKCAIAGLAAGGGKMVILQQPAFDRAAVFRALGERIERLRGAFYTAGDLGTTRDDLLHMAETTRYVRTDEGALGAAVGRGVRACIEACALHAGRDGLAGLRVAVQGCGAIGSAVATELAARGAELTIADIDGAAATRLAAATGATIVEPASILASDVDIVSPCAMGGVLTPDAAGGLRAWAVCGAANNILADPAVGDRLAAAKVRFVPDFIASAGAVIAGVCSLRGDDTTETLIESLGATTLEVLDTSVRREVSAQTVAVELAEARLGSNPS
jgi:leucine dehydrogenase